MEKEKIKREKLFAKQVIHIVKVILHVSMYCLLLKKNAFNSIFYNYFPEIIFALLNR